MREQELEEKERQVEDLERAVAEMQRLKKYSGGGSSTTPGTDLGNDSGIKNTAGLNNHPIFNKSIDRVFFTSPTIGVQKNLQGINNNSKTTADFSHSELIV